MQSNYKRLGDYIQLVDERNKDLEVKNLVGLTINKIFIPSVANIIGTDMSNYKIIRKNQFACSTMQVRRDKKMPLALYKNDEPAIISQAYPIFEIIDAKELLPEYLMMWFTRAEFDREACFHAVGGVRGSLEWDDFLDFKLPIPSVEKQQEIVNEYHTIQNRINLNNQLIAKLEETAQTIYKQWFVDFEFPFDFAQGKPSENGKPYKSNGGKMVWCEELEKEIPEGWEVGNFEDICENFDSQRKPLSGFERLNKKKIYPYYGAATLMDYIDDYIFEGTYILLGEDGSVVTENGTPVLQYVWGKFWVNNHAHVLKGKNGFNENSLYILLKNTNISDIITGGVQAKINQSNLNKIRVLNPKNTFLENLNKIIDPIFDLYKNTKQENQKLEDLKELLLAKMTRVEN